MSAFHSDSLVDLNIGTVYDACMYEAVQLAVNDSRDARYRRGARRAQPTRGPAEVSAAPAAATRRNSPAELPEGWRARLRDQSQNLSRALRMLEQVLAIIEEPRADTEARAQALRSAGLIALIAASEVLVISGWYEADHAVLGGLAGVRRGKRRPS